MMMRVGLGSVALLGLLACGGSNSDVKVTGADANSLATSPGGAATLTFMDLESIKPDNANLAAVVQASDGAQDVVGCRTFNTSSDGTIRTTTFTYTGCTAANGWAMTGTVTFQSPIASLGSYTSIFDLHSQDPTGTKYWAYSGTKLVTINFAQQTATLKVPDGAFMTVIYQDTLDTSKNKTYHYIPNLTGNWATLGQFKSHGQL